jgi:hypothetical protein
MINENADGDEMAVTRDPCVSSLGVLSIIIYCATDTDSEIK